MSSACAGICHPLYAWLLSVCTLPQKAMSVELAIELEHETFGDYVRRVSIVSVIVITFFVYPTICQVAERNLKPYSHDSTSVEFLNLSNAVQSHQSHHFVFI